MYKYNYFYVPNKMKDFVEGKDKKKPNVNSMPKQVFSSAIKNHLKLGFKESKRSFNQLGDIKIKARIV